MNELALFAGAGGGILASKLLGINTICAVEIGEYQRKVLLSRQKDGSLPKFPIWDDVATFDGKPWRGSIDVITGGFPCQDISAARTNSATNGEIKGLDGDRSGLWREYKRIIGEVKPKIVFAENSANLRTKGLATILKDFAELGFDARWGVVSCSQFRAPHQRKRMWIMATYANMPQCERRSLPRRREKEQPNVRLGTWWEAEPDICRVDDGMAHRMDRLVAIGNGQSPIVAAEAFRLMIK